MPGFNMFKAFGSSQSRNRNHPPDRPGYDYSEGFQNPEYHQPIPPPQLRRHETLTRRRKEPIFTPVPSRAPTDGEDRFDGYVRVDNPQTVLGGALNARPTRPESPLSPVPSVEREDGENRYSETFSEPGYIPSHSGLPEQSPLHHDHSSRAGSIHHGSVSGRHLPDDPQAVTHISRSEDDSESDHTIEGPRAPISSHSNARMAPHLQGVYVGKTPTNIYADGSREMRPIRHEENYPDNQHSHSRGHAPVYHSTPGGTSVIIQDGYGNEVARVGGFSGRPGLFVQDKYGREIYRSDESDYGRSHRHGEPRVLSMDAHQYGSRRPSGRSYSSQSYYSVPEYRHHDDYYQVHKDRGYKDGAYKDHYRDREYRGREYRDRDYRDKEYRDRDRDRYRDRDYRDVEYRDRDSRARDHRDRHNRDRDYYKRDDWRPEDRSRGPPPSIHRPGSSHTSSSRHEKQLAHSLSDDRQSNSGRPHDIPPSDMHHVEEIGDRLQSLQMG